MTESGALSCDPQFGRTPLLIVPSVGFSWNFLESSGYCFFSRVSRKDGLVGAAAAAGKIPLPRFHFWSMGVHIGAPPSASIDPLITFSLSSRRATCNLIRANARD